MCDGCAALEERVAVLEKLIGEQRPRIDPDELYTPREAAERLRCSQENVYGLLESGELAVTRTGVGGKGYRVHGADLQAFLDARREGGPRPKGNFKYLKLD